MSDGSEFDVQRRKPAHTRGPDRSARHFARGLHARHKTLIGRMFAIGAVVLGLLAVAGLLSSL